MQNRSYDAVGFGNRLSSILKEKGMRQRELADELKVSPNTVSMWCRGKTMPDRKNVLRMALILDVPFWDLLEGIEKQETDRTSPNVDNRDGV